MKSPKEHWQVESGFRIEGTRPLDANKVQTPCVVELPGGGFRMFYTAVGPAKPFPACQGYILSAVSEDGLRFQPEPGIRVQPRMNTSFMSLRTIGPCVVPTTDGQWRMYFEARGPANLPTVVCSAVSADMLTWELEPGIRLQNAGGVDAPRFVRLPDGRGRLYCYRSEFENGQMGGKRISQCIVSATSSDDLRFEMDPGYRVRDRETNQDSAGITTADVLCPPRPGFHWRMYYSAWEDVPQGTVVPLHPSHDPQAVPTGRSDDFAAVSIACDLSGYRSRIFSAYSLDGLVWERDACLIEALKELDTDILASTLFMLKICLSCN